MTKIDKLTERFLSEPVDFSWDELTKLLSKLNYQEKNMGKTSGSTNRFVHEKFEPIFLHKPHPSKILKRYQVKQIINLLIGRGQL